MHGDMRYEEGLGWEFLQNESKNLHLSEEELFAFRKACSGRETEPSSPIEQRLILPRQPSSALPVTIVKVYIGKVGS